MLRTRSIFLFTCLLFSVQATAQSPWYLGFQSQYGFLIAHRPSMVHLVEQHIPSAEIYFERKLRHKYWHFLYNYPDHGFSLYIGDMANSSRIGTGLAVIHYVNFHLINKSTWRLGLRLGTGVGFVQHIFDPVSNNKNNAIGSHINGIMSTQISFTRHWPRLRLGAGLSLLHYSNGSFTMPNLGLNMPAVFVTGTFRIGKPISDGTYFPDKEPIEPQWTFSSVVSGGLREIGQPQGPKYTCFSLENFANRRLNHKTDLLLGIDLINNGSLSKAWSTAKGEELNRWNFTQLGLIAGAELKMDALRISLQQGVYALSKYKGDGTWYQRLAIRYFFPNNLVAQLALKTHFAKADYLEAGIGYRWGKIEKKPAN